ncbi:MAG TPA: MATE family efflux transporter [Ferruginibacter sp.]|jgi:Na+-driven multidrug efflux pump|nr:MATE family efflux transporter [Ferruginibacter sp.]
MDSTAITKDLKVKVTNKQILSIALPITLAILIPQINMLTNNIFLGDLNIDALGNAGITGVFYLIFAVAGHGLNNSLQSVFSRYAGSDNPEAFKTILAQGIRISLQFAFAGIIITWFLAPLILKQVADPAAYPQEISFLKIRIMGLPFLYLFQMCNAFLVASLNSRYLMIGFICEAGLNILLDFLLIKGRYGFPALGFNGAAVASVIAEIFGFIVVLIVLYRTGLKKQYDLLKTWSYNKIITSQVLTISAPLMLQYVISVTTWLVFFILIEGLHDPTAKAISNTMRNVFGLTGVFVWAFASTCNVMVSNLMGQKREDKVIEAITRIMLLSIAFCVAMCLLVNIFPGMFFGLFGQGEAFVKEGIPVLRMVSFGLLFMSIANIWLNGVTGTGKTKVNLLIEIVAITVYLLYSWYFVKVHYISLPMAWSNELVYWFTIFVISFIYLKSGKWKTKQILPS